MPFMRRIIPVLLSLACCPLGAGIDVTFPAADTPEDGATLRAVEGFVGGSIINDRPEPVRIGGMVVYHLGLHYSAVEAPEPETFDKSQASKAMASLSKPWSRVFVPALGFIRPGARNCEMERGGS